MPLNDNEPEVALLKRNLSTLLRALRSSQVTFVEVTYAGARGRCQPCQVTVTPHGIPAVLDSPVVLERLSADAGQVPVAAIEERLTISEGLKHFTLHWASLEHGHWQRGDGGHGVMRIVVTSRLVTLDHDAVHIESHHTTLKE